MMPIAWTRTYKAGDKEGRAFCTTMGAATDLLSEGTRRMIVNAVYWCLGMENQIPAEGTKVDLVGQYEPTKFGFNGFVKDKTPKDYIAGGLSCQHLEVEGDGQHFFATIVSDAFVGKRLIARHQLVYAALGERMREEIHALSMKTLTPDEWKSA